MLIFGGFCLFQYYICIALLNLMRPVNWLCSAVGWVPFASLQNQLVFKANLVGTELPQKLMTLFGSGDYAEVLQSYLAVLNTLVVMVFDSSLGLISLMFSHAFIVRLLQILRYVTSTVHLLFLGGRFWTSTIKSALEFSPAFSELLDTAIAFVVETGKHISFSFDDLFVLYKVVAYLGLSCQVLLTVELAYLSSFSVLILYKGTALLYKHSLTLLVTLYRIVKSTLRNNLTVKVPPMYLNPAVKVVSTLFMILLGSLLPSIVVHYLWFIASVLLFRLATVYLALNRTL